MNELYRLQRKDLADAAAVLADAFRHDPLWAKVFEVDPSEPRFQGQFRAFFEVPLRYCLRYGGVYASSEHLEGIVTWLPRRYVDMTLRRLLLSRAIGPALRMGVRHGRRLQNVIAPLSSYRCRLMHGRDYVYLPVIGVASAFQGRGFGRRMLSAVIDRCERAGLPLYLETETEANVELYRAFGFRTMQAIVLPVIDAPMWLMLRESASRPGAATT